MKTRRILALLLALIMAAFIAGCGQTAPAPSAPPPASSAAPASASAAPSPSPSETAAAGPISITDMTGRVVKLDKPAQKVVVLTASDCEIVYALGAGATVVGRGQYCDYPKEVSSVTAVQSGKDTNIEQIISLKPDVVLMSTMAQTKEQVASLEGAGIKVIMSDAQNINGIYTAITMLGQVVGKNDEAKKMVDSMKKAFDDLKAKAQANAKGEKTIYFEVSPLQYGLMAAGSGTFMDELATMLGLKNLFGDLKSWAKVSEEQILQRNPDYIVSTTMSMAGAQNPIDEIMGRKGWENVTAVKNKAIFNADSNSSALMHPGPRLVEAAQQLYDFVYGGKTTAAPSPTK